MRYAAISLAIAVLLVATPVYSQEKSYIVVETPRTTEPTTVITGESFVQTYIVRFIDLTGFGEKIIVQEEALKLKTLGSFEVVDFSTDKQTKQREFLEHIWRLRYTLRIINPKKGAYTIPSIVVPWKHKKAGQEENDPAIPFNYDFKTDEVNVTYASTIPEKETNLEIRDEVDFGNFEKQVWVWKIFWWLLAILLAGFWLVLLARNRFFRKLSEKLDEPEADNKNAVAEVTVDGRKKELSKFRTWFSLRRSIRQLRNCRRGLGESGQNPKVKLEIIKATKDFLMARVRYLKIGDTPAEMTKYIFEKMDRNSTKRIPFLKLAQKAYQYQTEIEKGESNFTRDPKDEADDIAGIIRNLRWHNRFVVFFWSKFGEDENKLC